MPGISPRIAASRILPRARPNLRNVPRGLPVMAQRLRRRTGEALRGSAEFSVTSGVLRGVDLAAAARLLVANTEHGDTRFDRFGGTVELDGGAIRLSRLDIASGVLAADGALSIDRERRLDGEVRVTLRGTASLVSTPLEVSGTTADPVVRPARAVLAGAAAGTAVLGPGLGTAVGLKAGELARRLFKPGRGERDQGGRAAPGP